MLRSNFGYAKDEVIGVLSSLLSAAELSFESEQALEVALQLYRKSAADSPTACTSHWSARPESSLFGRSTGARPRSTGAIDRPMTARLLPFVAGRF